MHVHFETQPGEFTTIELANKQELDEFALNYINASLAEPTLLPEQINLKIVDFLNNKITDLPPEKALPTTKALKVLDVISDYAWLQLIKSRNWTRITANPHLTEAFRHNVRQVFLENSERLTGLPSKKFYKLPHEVKESVCFKKRDINSEFTKALELHTQGLEVSASPVPQAIPSVKVGHYNSWHPLVPPVPSAPPMSPSSKPELYKQFKSGMKGSGGDAVKEENLPNAPGGPGNKRS